MILVAQACSGDDAEEPPRESRVNEGGAGGDGSGPDTGAFAGDSSGGQEGRAGEGGVATVAGAGGVAIVAGAGLGGAASGESSTAGAGGQGDAAGAAGRTPNGAGGAGGVETAGAGGAGAGGETNAVTETLTPVDGWVDGNSNALGIQGVVFAFADQASASGLVMNFTGSNACIKGTAARVDLGCTPVFPATDCVATFWGAAIGLNLNQSLEGQSVGSPMPYDASAVRGFAFEVTGPAVPTSLRFRVEDGSVEYCTPASKPVKIGANTFLFSELIAQCWKPGGASAVSAKSGLIRIAWQVVTNSQTTVPFDYCIENLRALR